MLYGEDMDRLGEDAMPVTYGVAHAPEPAGDPLNSPDREIFRVVFRRARGATRSMAEGALNAVTRNFDRERGVNRAHDRVMQLMPAGNRNRAGSRTSAGMRRA